MKLGHLLDQMVKLKKAGNHVSFSDKELGKLEIVCIENGIQIKKDFTIEIAKLDGSGYVALLEFKQGTGLSIVD